MRSTRTKITILNVIGISAALLVATTISAITIAVQGHVENAHTAFSEAAKNTNWVLTYYYRIDSEYTATGEKGFFETKMPLDLLIFTYLLLINPINILKQGIFIIRSGVCDFKSFINGLFNRQRVKGSIIF